MRQLKVALYLSRTFSCLVRPFSSPSFPTVRWHNLAKNSLQYERDLRASSPRGLSSELTYDLVSACRRLQTAPKIQIALTFDLPLPQFRPRRIVPLNRRERRAREGTNEAGEGATQVQRNLLPPQVESTINDSHKVYDTTINCHQPMATKVAPTINLDHKSRTDYKLGPQKSHRL